MEREKIILEVPSSLLKVPACSAVYASYAHETRPTGLGMSLDSLSSMALCFTTFSLQVLYLLRI